MDTIRLIGSPLYQWEIGRKIEITPSPYTRVDKVEFSHPGDANTLSLVPREENGVLVADIPNVLLQSGNIIFVYLVHAPNGGVETTTDHVLRVIRRPKPADYVYTETEVLNYHSLADRIDQIEQNGVSDERIGEAVEIYFEENPDKIPSVNADWLATKEFVSGGTVYIPEQKISSGLWNKLQANLQAGSRYEVTLNGEVYTCIARWYDDGIILGNNPAITLNDYPFCIHWAGVGATGGLFFKRNDISYPLTLKVTDHAEYVYNKMPEEYLPDSVASVSTAGVGQVLAVKEVDANGKPTAWEAVNMPTGGGGLIITDDENGNVTIESAGSVNITDDGNGNVTIV